MLPRLYDFIITKLRESLTKSTYHHQENIIQSSMTYIPTNMDMLEQVSRFECVMLACGNEN
jgi:predicted nucleotidyltransferase